MTLKVDGIGTNPIYLNNSYPVTNSFRGDYTQTDSVTLDTSQINTTNIAPLEKDTLNISASDKIKTQQKEKGMSTATKVGLTIVGAFVTTYACVVGHRMLTKQSIEKVAQNFSEIFRRDVSKDEAQKMADRYKEILKESDVDSLCSKLFNQVKKDYGYENINIKLDIDKITEEARKKEAGGGWILNKARVTLRPYCVNGQKMTASDKKQILNTLMHEFQHVKQAEIAYRTNAEKYIQIIRKNNELPTGDKLKKELEEMKAILKDDGRLKTWARERNQTVEQLKTDINKALNNKDYSAFINFNEKECRQNLENLFGKYPKLKINSEEYKKGEKYLENEANYISAYDNETGYLEQILEKEAYGAEKKLKLFYEYIKSIW